MSEIMRPLPFPALMDYILEEFRRSQSIFGIRSAKFYRNASGVRMRRCGVELDSPIGPAAGPHSQLAENIVAAYLAGSRFIELKTVQTMDGEELRNCVARPCINATDECYNVEWSTELTVEQAQDEYIKAWIIVHVLAREFDLGTGTVFNMSVGYSLEGIQSKKIDDYLENLRDASDTAVWKEAMDWLKTNVSRFSHITSADIEALPSQVSNSVTLSTLHGCPREEIERIAFYLLNTKHFHTSIKCNPTLLGYESARSILDSLGYDYLSFDEHHFKEDLQFDEAVAMIGRLQETADSLGLDFGVKITNTFPVDIKRGELPGEEMYMSGRALFPLSVTAADRLSVARDGKLQISYSGGADAFNIADLLQTGIRPVTMATTLLKPGGYERLNQLAHIAESSLDPARTAIDVQALSDLAGSFSSRKRHNKEQRSFGLRKATTGELPLVDCAQAPCSLSGCPIDQQIPAYLEQVEKGDFEQAFKIIVNDNVLPSTTAAICDHQCQNRCTRLDYDDPLQIRSAKKAAVQAAAADSIARVKPTELRTSERVLVIGAGPAGLAAAGYLRRNGVEVTVRETREKALGMVSATIPAFRISDEECALDVALAEALGVRFEFGAAPDYDLNELTKQYRFVILATGASLPGSSDLDLSTPQIIDALDFLEQSRASDLAVPLGARVAVIGGGDVAMDCARAAARNQGVEQASILYRRRRAQMPASPEERMLAEADGIEMLELRSPVSFADNILTCDIMRLGEPDASGRASVERTGEQETYTFDVIISATGARVDTTGFVRSGLQLDERGFALISEANETSIPGVYIAGDCKAGPQTVVKAMADAKLVAKDILAKLELAADFEAFELEACRPDLIRKKGVLTAAVSGSDHAQEDAARCLGCSEVCGICVDVCPNRANTVIDLGEDHETEQRYQIVHIDRLCNECGNCSIFCPTAGDPYKDKFTVFPGGKDFAESKNRGFCKVDANLYRARLKGGSEIDFSADSNLPKDFAILFKTITSSYPWLYCTRDDKR